MAGDPSDEERTRYRRRVLNGFRTAIFEAGQVEGGEGTTIDIQVVLTAMCDVMAGLLTDAGDAETPSKRRAAADQVRKQVLITLNQVAGMKAAGTHEAWSMEQIGKKHS